MSAPETADDSQTKGYLATDFRLTVESVKAENPEWFLLMEDINNIFQRIIAKGAKTHHGKSMNPKVLATFSAIRSIGNFQSAIMSLERGMITEAKIMARCLYENSFCMGALAEKPKEFIPLLEQDNLAAKRGQAKVLIDGNYPLSTEIHSAIEIHLDRKKETHLDWKKIASMSALKSSYLVYKHLSDDAMHFSASSLQKHIISTPDKKTWHGYSFGPGTKDEVCEAADLCSSATFAIIVGYLQATEDRSFDIELNGLLDRFSEVTKKYDQRVPSRR